MNEDLRDEVEPRERTGPMWFRLGGFAALAFYLLGLVMFALQVTADPATMPVDQRELWEASPSWMVALAAASGLAGVLGALMLILRRRAALFWLGLALILLLAHFAPLVLMPSLRNLIDDSALTGPIVLAGIAYGFWHLARLGARRGWNDR